MVVVIGEYSFRGVCDPNSGSSSAHTNAKVDKLQECAQLLDDIAAVTTGAKMMLGKITNSVPEDSRASSGAGTLGHFLQLRLMFHNSWRTSFEGKRRRLSDLRHRNERSTSRDLQMCLQLCWCACEVQHVLQFPWVSGTTSFKNRPAPRVLFRCISFFCSVADSEIRRRWNEVAACASHVRESPIPMAMTRK